MKIVKMADISSQNKKDISDLKRDIKEFEKDVKSIRSDIKKIQKDIDNLNIGTRRWWQQQTVFTSVQRKLERFEKIEEEWKKYKDNMDDKVKKAVERLT